MASNRLCPLDKKGTILPILTCLLVEVATILLTDCMVGRVGTILIIMEVLTHTILHHITLVDLVDLVEDLDLMIIIGVLLRRIIIKCLHRCHIQVKPDSMVDQVVRTVTLPAWRDALDPRLMGTILVRMELHIQALHLLLVTMEDNIPTIQPMSIPIQAQSPPLGASDLASLNLRPMSLARSAPLKELMKRRTSPIFHWHIRSAERTVVLAIVH